MKRVFFLAAAAMMTLAGCATYQGGTTTTDSGVIRGSETDESTSDFGRGESWRNQDLIRDDRPAGGFHP
jgi:hypothetical protein